MTDQSDTFRCRLVLVLSGERLIVLGEEAPALIDSALSGGDVASIIFAQNTLDETTFGKAVEPCIAATHKREVAAIVAGEPRIAGRLGADGMQYGQDVEGLRDGVERYQSKFMVGAGNIRSRHTALIIGEAQPDYVFFGKAGGDTKATPLPRNLELAAWWAALIEIPCIVMGGNTLDSVVPASATKAEFVALGSAIFGSNEDAISPSKGSEPADLIRKANELLDEHAPLLENADDN